MSSQLTLFEVKEQMFDITYWAFPFTKSGELMSWQLNFYHEIRNLKGLQFLQDYCFKYKCEYFNVKICEI